LYDDLLALTGATRVLEIGCGPGKFTEPLARRGVTIDALEPGPALADYARSKLADWPRVKVYTSSFEAWQTDTRYDLVVAASSFHWLDPETRFQRCSGFAPYLALCWPGGRHTKDDEFETAVQPIYEAIAPALAEKNQAVEDFTRTEASPLFEPVERRFYPWEARLTSGEYVHVLNTFSNHLTLPDDARTRLHEAIRRLLDERFGGVLVRTVRAVLDLRQVKTGS
jgi:SAM-dependent methyltransferase